MLEIHMDGIIFSIQRHGGITRNFKNLINCLVRQDDVKINIYLPVEAQKRMDFPDAIETVRYPSPLRMRPDRIFSSINSIRLHRAINRMWKKINFGIFHSTYYSTHSELSIPQVLTIHDMIYEIFPECFSRENDHHHIKEKARCAEAASAIICPSKSALGEAHKHYNLDGKAMAVIPHAVDPVFLSKCQEDQLKTFRDKYTDNHPFVMFVGSRWAHKNFIGLLTAYTRWKSKKKFHLLAVGGGEPSHYELNAVNCLGVNDLVHFCADLDEEGLTIAYNSAKAVIVPSLCEGFGFPVLEAMACGTPVASSTGGSLPEVGGNIPVYFDPQNNDQLVDALDEVIQISIDSHRIHEGIHRARERTWEQVTEEYVQVYRSVSNE